MSAFRAARDKALAELAMADEVPNVVELHPTAIKRFPENLESLTEILSSEHGKISPDLTQVFRELVGAVVIKPRTPGEDYVFELKGYLSALLGTEGWPDGMSATMMVAREGLEPPTQGL